MFNQIIFKQQLQKIRQVAPLTHCLTNDVVSNFTANVLLATGASPAMIVSPKESAEFARMASALLINVGTLTVEQSEAMRLAIQSANDANVPWVLDPVAFGVVSFRTEFCQELLLQRPAVIRGNASEIAAIAGQLGQSKGADSLMQTAEALDAAKKIALEYHTIVALTGEVDYVTDGVDTYSLHNGHVQLTRVTGTGCSLSALLAAYCAVCDTPLLAALTALSHMAIAGEIAAEQTKGVGQFAVSLLDQLQLLFLSDEERVVCKKL